VKTMTRIPREVTIVFTFGVALPGSMS